MARMFPVVEIDNRHYSRPLSLLSTPTPSPKQKKQSHARRSDSSSPEYVSANKVASSSTSKVNGLTRSKPANNSSSSSHSHIVVDLAAPRIGQYPAPKRNFPDFGASVPPGRRVKKEQEVVVPPVNEPCLASIFDEDSVGLCVWSPTHRIAKNVEAVTCQWITSDEGFGAVERCEKIFTTIESLAKHVQFAHCEGPRPKCPYIFQVTCAWGSCKFKRYTPDRLKEHVLDHLRPLAYSCPFQQCRMSINSHSKSADDLDLHIQTYHTNGELLLPLGIPKQIKPLTNSLPALLPTAMPQWIVNNPPIGVPREARRPPPSPSPEPAVGVVRPWDQLWLEMNKVEPPAVPLPLGELTPQQRSENAPVIDVATIPAAISLPLQPSTSAPAKLVGIDLPAADRKITFIDMTGVDLETLPPATPQKYPPVVDMTAASLAKRQAKRDYLDRLKAGLVESSPSPSSSTVLERQTHANGSSSNGDQDSVERARKRVKIEL